MTVPARLVPIAKAIACLQANPDPDCRAVGDEMARLYASNASRFGARNGKSLAYSTSLTERNRLLRALWRKHDRWRDLPTGAAARAMLTAFSRYEAGRWLIDSRALSAPPQEPEATFWRILMAEETLPGSIKQMRRVLEGDG